MTNKDYECGNVFSLRFLHLSRLLGTGRRFPVIVLHRSEKSGRTNLMKVTAVPNCPEYSENEGEQT